MSHYFYYEGNTQKGPVSQEELLKNITLETEIWTQGMTDWKKAKDVPEIAALLAVGNSSEIPSTQETITESNTEIIPQQVTNNQSSTSGNASRQSTNTPDFQNLLIWSIVSAFLCCNVSGIIGIVLNLKAEVEWTKGNYDKAWEKYKNAKIWVIVGAVLGLILIIISYSFSALLTSTMLSNMGIDNY